MDSQLQIVLEAVMADPNHAWAGFTLESHDLLALEPTDASMVNGHFTTHAPLYLQALGIAGQDSLGAKLDFGGWAISCQSCRSRGSSHK